MVWFVVGATLGFLVGALIGVRDTKQAYDIPKGVTPEEYLATQDMLVNAFMQDSEVVGDGNDLCY